MNEIVVGALLMLLGACFIALCALAGMGVFYGIWHFQHRHMLKFKRGDSVIWNGHKWKVKYGLKDQEAHNKFLALQHGTAEYWLDLDDFNPMKLKLVELSPFEQRVRAYIKRELKDV